MTDAASAKRTGPERRKYARFQIPSSELKCAKAGFISFLNRPFTAELTNVSAGGMRIKTATPLKSGEAVAGKIVIRENGDSVEFSGHVVWAYTLPPQYRSDPPTIIAGVLFNKADVAREAKIESMRKWFTSDRYKTTRRFAKT